MTGPARDRACACRPVAGHRRKFGMEFNFVLFSIIQKLRNLIPFGNFFLYSSTRCLCTNCLWTLIAQWRHAAYQNTLPDHSWIKLYVNIQVDGAMQCEYVVPAGQPGVARAFVLRATGWPERTSVKGRGGYIRQFCHSSNKDQVFHHATSFFKALRNLRKSVILPGFREWWFA